MIPMYQYVSIKHFWKSCIYMPQSWNLKTEIAHMTHRINIDNRGDPKPPLSHLRSPLLSVEKRDLESLSLCLNMTPGTPSMSLDFVAFIVPYRAHIISVALLGVYEYDEGTRIWTSVIWISFHLQETKYDSQPTLSPHKYNVEILK